MPTEKLTFENAEGERLAARLERPADEAPVAYALFAHGFACSGDLQAARAISRALCRVGIAVLRLDFTGLGEGEEGDAPSASPTSGVADLVAAARFLKKEHEAPAFLVGHSLGGAAVLRAAVEVGGVKAVATIGAPAELSHVRHLLEDAEGETGGAGEATVTLADRSFQVKERFLESLDGQALRAAARDLGAALLVLHAPQDEAVSIDSATALFKAARHPKSFVSLGEADHLLTNPADAAFAGNVLAAWAARYAGAPQRERKEGAPDDNRVVARTPAGGLRTDVFANGHALVSDEPTSVPGGTNEGPTPYDYLGVALGACTSMTLRMYADRKKWPLEEAVTRVRHAKIYAEDCAHCDTEEGKLDRLEREVELVGDLSEEQRARLLEIANRCPVHRTFEGEIDVATSLRAGEKKSG